MIHMTTIDQTLLLKQSHIFFEIFSSIFTLFCLHLPNWPFSHSFPTLSTLCSLSFSSRYSYLHPQRIVPNLLFQFPFSVLLYSFILVLSLPSNLDSVFHHVLMFHIFH
ncbi:hypothetical protein GUJ93_ZPchr0007g3665 [Zizania palustris]|uniref:Uncharacterized protein n=1 Tax=Zizania palustris TaxID=103762 RepID=A0A8J5TG99_ZIZPA|nr:hypothetical protein GUJ93_ZPchr0007g3665 [Zizania palustris]